MHFKHLRLTFHTHYHLREQTPLLRERLLLAWETALERIDWRCQIAQDHQDLRLQRQRLLSEQAAYLEDLSPGLAWEHASD
jgi:hypothetical protein